MSEPKCPLCGSERFYVKDAEDQYAIQEFDLKEGKIVFRLEESQSELPNIVQETETHCSLCAWHGKFGTLTRAG